MLIWRGPLWSDGATAMQSYHLRSDSPITSPQHIPRPLPLRHRFELGVRLGCGPAVLTSIARPAPLPILSSSERETGGPQLRGTILGNNLLRTKSRDTSMLEIPAIICATAIFDRGISDDRTLSVADRSCVKKTATLANHNAPTSSVRRPSTTIIWDRLQKRS
jgi:hypothetical protein